MIACEVTKHVSRDRRHLVSSSAKEIAIPIVTPIRAIVFAMKFPGFPEILRGCPKLYCKPIDFIICRHDSSPRPRRHISTNPSSRSSHR
ncbi:unnamed protein product [Tuber aestivum]|uniref:Uncharacterized protein n=1 Tax=Tuber aestivum TaxID=59557 RepID=A0A292Q513_9PEZI|nr:unnamed protein product [Tuber aestivum]